MAVQTVQTSPGVSLEAPKTEVVPGVVNFYTAVLDLGDVTCKLLLKEYPNTTRELGICEIRAYEELFGPLQGGAFSELEWLARQELEQGAPLPKPGARSVPAMYASFEAFLITTQDQAVTLQTTLEGTQSESDQEDVSSVLTHTEPSVWLAFRLGEHGTATLLDRRDAHLKALQAAAEEAWRRRTGQTTDDYRSNIRSMLSILMPFERVPEDPSTLWAEYTCAAMRSSLEALAFVHSRGVAHNSLSSACMLVNSVATEDAAQLQVKLYNFGYAITGLYEGVGSDDQQALIGSQPSAFREDIFDLGLAFCDLLFPGMSEAGTDFRRVAVDVYGCDMNAFYEFVAEEEPWGVSLLSNNGGSGWELLGMMLRAAGGTDGRNTADSNLQGQDRISAQSLLQSRFFETLR